MNNVQAMQRIGETVDRYKIESVLGSGGFGAVFRARHVMMDRQVALKLLHPSAAASDEIRERFIREARTLGKLGHPHIIEIYDCGVTNGGELFLAMQLLEGEDLSERAEKHRLTVDAVVDVTVQVLDALEAAHAAGIVHRDLKPANVYLATQRGQEVVKLLDFGISKLDAGEGTGLTHTGVVMGTPHYMAPELFSGMKGADHRADIYAVGVMLYELFSGGPPHDAASYEQLVVKIATTDPTPLRQKLPSLPEALQQVVEQALRRDPDQRFSSAKEMRTALERARGASTVPLQVDPSLAFAATGYSSPLSSAPTGAASGPSGPLTPPPARAPVDMMGGVAPQSTPMSSASLPGHVPAPAMGGSPGFGGMPQAIPPSSDGGDMTKLVWGATGVLTLLVAMGIGLAVLSSQDDDSETAAGPNSGFSVDVSPHTAAPHQPPVVDSIGARGPMQPAQVVAPQQVAPQQVAPQVAAPPVQPSIVPQATNTPSVPAATGGRIRMHEPNFVSSTPPSSSSIFARFESQRAALQRCRRDVPNVARVSLMFNSGRVSLATAHGSTDEEVGRCVASIMREAGPIDSQGSGIIQLVFDLPPG